MDGLDLTKSTYERVQEQLWTEQNLALDGLDPFANAIFSTPTWNVTWDTLSNASDEARVFPEGVLQEAHRLINGDRAKTYGDSVYNDFKTIGELWSILINSRHGTNVDVSSDDVGLMMLLLKVARAMKNSSHRDSLVDIAGYAGCVARLRGIDQ